jgi:hypothetical protein
MMLLLLLYCMFGLSPKPQIMTAHPYQHDDIADHRHLQCSNTITVPRLCIKRLTVLVC